MTALSDNYEVKRKDGELVTVPVLAAAVIYKGALVVDKGTGYASAGVDGSSYVLLGVAAEKADNSASGASDGDVSVRLYKTGSFLYNKATAVQTDLGVAVYIHDDQTVGTSSTNSVLAGYVCEYVSSSTLRVRIDRAVA